MKLESEKQKQRNKLYYYSLKASKISFKISNMSSSRKAIVNGDDFGFSTEVNQAILRAHDKGILTSTSLMVTGNGFEEAVALAKARPKLGVGLHLVLVCGKSVLEPEKIPHLVDENRNFPRDPVRAGLHYQFNRAARQELRLEIRAQLEKFRQTGLQLSHVDGHLHLHCHPVVLENLAEFVDEFQINFVRLPYEELSLNLNFDRANLLTKVIWSSIFTSMRRYGENLLAPKGIGFAERVYGLLQTGKITEQYLLHSLGKMKADLIEIYSHPNLEGSGKIELAALLSDRVRETLHSNNFQLTNYNDLRMSEEK